MQQIRLRPSEAATWTVCTEYPWALLENQHRLPEDTDTTWSIEGNRAHDLAQVLLETGQADFDDDAQAKHLYDYAEFVLGKMKEGDTLLVEPPVPLWYMPERNGKIDSAILGNKRVYITDLKYGEGYAVYARQNKQLAIYGRALIEWVLDMGLMDIEDSTLITLAIFQPRCSHGERITLWALTWAELKEFTDPIAEIADKIKRRDGLKLDASDKAACKWCDLQAICAEYIRKHTGGESMDMLGEIAPEAMTFRQAEEALAVHPEQIAWPDPVTLTPERIAKILHHADDIVGYIGKVREYAKGILNSGDPSRIPGWKLVQGQAGKRQWVDEKAAETLLSGKLTKAQRTKAHLISPAQAEKLIPKAERNPQFDARWNKLVVRPPASGKVLVPITDDRETITVQAFLEFDNLDEVIEGSNLL